MAGQLRRNVLAKMWDETQQRFCDGLCANGTSANGSIYTDYTTLFLGLVPEEARAAVWRSVATHGLERIGAYILLSTTPPFDCHSLCSRPTQRALLDGAGMERICF